MTDIEKGAERHEKRQFIQAKLIAMAITENVIVQTDIPQLVESRALSGLSIAAVRKLASQLLQGTIGSRETIDERVWNVLYGLDEHDRINLLMEIDYAVLNEYFNGAIAPLLRTRLKETTHDERNLAWMTRAVQLFVDQAFLAITDYQTIFPPEVNLLKGLPEEQRLSSVDYMATLSLFGLNCAVQGANRRGIVEFILLHAGIRSQVSIPTVSKPPPEDANVDDQGRTMRPALNRMNDDELRDAIVACVARHGAVKDGAWTRPLSMTLQAIILAETKRAQRHALAARLSLAAIETVATVACAVLRSSPRAYAQEVIQLLRQRFPALPRPTE